MACRFRVRVVYRPVLLSLEEPRVEEEESISLRYRRATRARCIVDTVFLELEVPIGRMEPLKLLSISCTRGDITFIMYFLVVATVLRSPVLGKQPYCI